MINCEYCPEGFIDTENGLAEFMFHTAIKHADDINEENIVPGDTK